jgi:RNA polymerase sigma-70 factor (ECF subfamily)
MMNWPEIMREHGPLVWRVVYRLLNHEADAADCFQRTFISALELSRKEAIQHWPALMRRLATTRALELLRQRCRNQKRFQPLDPDQAIRASTLEPGHLAAANELAEHLRMALADLDGRQAEVFCMACLEGCTYEEVAKELGVTINHVGVLLNRARAALRERLQPHAPAGERVNREEGT